MSARKRKKNEVKTGFWEQLSDRNKHLICLGFLFILPFILFYSTTIGGKQYMGHDTIQWRAGAESIIDYRETTGEVAHWATNMFSGMPATTISHPPQVWNLDNTFLKLLSFIYPAAEFWILFAGAYVMFLLMGIRPLAAVFGSVAIGFSTYIPIIIEAGHHAKFISYIFAPWLFAGYLLVTKSSINKWIALSIFTLALTLHLRAYHPQVTYFFLFPLGTLFIYDLIKSVIRNDTWQFLNKTGILLSAAFIASLITIQLYWSTAEYSAYSMRGGSEIENTQGLDQSYAFAWSQGPGELLTLVIPGSFGGSSSDAYWGPKSFTSGPHYMGSLTFLFFLLGLLKSAHRLKWVFFGSGLATMLFSLGENFQILNGFMFHYFPLFDKFRAPEMWLMVTVFCFSVVAVFGLQWVFNKAEDQLKKTELNRSLITVVGISAILSFICFQFLTFEKPGERSQIEQQIASQNQVPVDDPRVKQATGRIINSELIPARKEMARSDSLRFALFIVLGTGLIWVATNRKISASTSAAALCLLVAIDMIQVDQRFLSESSIIDGNIEREQVIESQGRELDRFIQNNNTHANGWKYRTLPLLDNPFNNAIPSYFYPSAGGYSGAKLGYYQDLIDEALFSGPSGINQGILNMLNIKYLTVQPGLELPGFSNVFDDSRGAVLENNNVLPKAFFTESIEVMNSEPEVLRRLSEASFDPSKTALITKTLADWPENRISSGTATVNQYSPNGIAVDLETESGGFLVLSEIWYPPSWTATLNGEKIDIIRTNYVLRGFEIPAGSHRLELKSEPSWYQIGNWLSYLGTVILLGLLISGIFIHIKSDQLSQLNE